MIHPSSIIGSEKLIEIFDEWPVFHDAELVSIKLQQTSRHKYTRPSLEAIVEFASVRIHFLFFNISNLRLSEFFNYNSLLDLSITDVRECQMEEVRFTVHFDPSIGTEASFQCQEIEVLSVDRNSISR